MVQVPYDLEEGKWANLLWKILANFGDSEIYPRYLSPREFQEDLTASVFFFFFFLIWA